MADSVLRSPTNARGPRTLDEARAFIEHLFAPVVATEWVPTSAALGRVLAEDVVAVSPLPRARIAAMDGFAIRTADLGEGVAGLRVVGVAAAGAPTAPHIGPREALRISTGAVVPEGADRVVQLEKCRVAGNLVTLSVGSDDKPHVRMPGEDVAPGQTVLRAGTRLHANHLCLMDALRVERLAVCRKLEVALLSSGNELREVSEPLLPWQIVDVNRPALRQSLLRLGCAVSDLGIVPDVSDTLLRTLVDAARDADLIVTTGGVSVGAADFMRETIARRGYLEFWQLAMRPGRPVAFGDIDACPVLALPGNPLAAAATFAFIGRPLIGRLAANAALSAADLSLPLEQPAEKPERLDVLSPARVVRGADGASVLCLLPDRGSASLLSLAEADGIARLPRGVDRLPAGAPIDFVRL